MNKDNINTSADTEQEELPCVSRGFAIVFIAIFMSILILPTLAWGVLRVVGYASPELWEAINFDTDENRKLASFPDKFDPETVTADIENWYNDNLPFRSAIYTAQFKAKNAIEKPYTDVIFPALIKVFHPSAPPENDPDDDIFLENTDTEETFPAEDDTQKIPDKDTQNEGDINCDHVIGEGIIEKDPTCTEYGVMLYSCTKCSYKYHEYIRRVAHDYVVKNEYLPTCKSSGEATYECSVCDKTYVKTLAPAHNGNVVKVVEPSTADYGYTLKKCSTCGGMFRTDIKKQLSNNSYYPARYSRNTILARNNWFFYAAESSIDFYQGTNLLPESKIDAYMGILVELKEICDERGIQLQVMFLPNKNQVYSEHFPSIEVTNQYKRTERIFDYIKENSDVPIIFPQAELKAAKPYWQVYYQYDTHWNKAGAFIGTQALYKALGLETTDLSLQKVTLSPRVNAYGQASGDLFGQGGIDPSQYTPENEYYITYKPEIHVNVIGGSTNNGDYYQTISTAPNDTHFVLIADSFRVNMLSYLEKDFAKCTIANRSYNMQDPVVIDAIRDADILVISAVERADIQIFYTAQLIIQILQSE